MSVTAVLAFVGAAFATGLAVAALSRRPALPNYAFAFGMLMLAAEAVFTGLAFEAATPEQLFTCLRWRLAMGLAVPAPWLLFSLSYSRGLYKQTLTRWMVPLSVGIIFPAAVAIFGWDELIIRMQISELPQEWFFIVGNAGSIGYLLVLVVAILIVMNLERTFRASIGTTRWRLKYVVLGVGLFFGARVYTTSQALLFLGTSSSLVIINTVSLLLACGLITVGFIRAGLAHVDVYPSRALLQNSLTVLLAGVYLFVVGVLAKIVLALGGLEAFWLKALFVLVAVVVLAILLLSERLRNYIRRFVSRHFNRPHYDFAKVWSTFSAQTASVITASNLSRVVAKWLSETFQALSVSMWVLDPAKGQLVLGNSTSLADEITPLAPLRIDPSELIKRFGANPAPIDLADPSQEWTEVLQQAHPDVFRHSGSKICVPLIAGPQFMGFILLGDRVNGVPFTLEELDLLKCIASQVAGNLQNIQLSQHLLEAKEMEAFQTMSAFFVHDLKNTASTLSLMLQNLPEHFDDPEFRQDALRGLSKSVGRVNDLIGRLTALRQELDFKLTPVDVNELVEASVRALPSLPGISIVRKLQPTGRIPLDADKIRKVITNILMNAVDALGEHGEIRIDTQQRDGSVALSISDNGPGMTPEFMGRSLFRPFQTTKKKGIGIGMFLSKMVVEAHHGKIEVESQPGKGTTFRVLLPLNGKAA